MKDVSLVVYALLTTLLAVIGIVVIIDLLALLLTCDSISGMLTSNAKNVTVTYQETWRSIGFH